ncbi:STU2 (YLR045C) [Zygosaccharomyces parabailii]|nr:STU2 (YLR045C) [Zygosaccharomyces parabailii]
MSTADEDTDFTRLPLNERLEHKLWKARLHGYQELNETFKKNPDSTGAEYWQLPELFGKYITDSNVVAQEQAILCLESLINNVPLPSRLNLRNILEVWIPALAEKGLSSSRSTTKNKATECILLLCSYDTSISQSVELLLPFCEKKLPKLVATSAHCLKELIASFGLTNVQTEALLPQLLEPLVKLAGHADRNVRSETMGLIVEIYKCTGKNKALLQELLLDQLKPIQQRDLDKLFTKADAENSSETTRLFAWQKEQLENNQKQQQVEQPPTDHDGDTMMEFNIVEKVTKAHGNKSTAKPIDPLDLLPEQTILDKLPDDFYNRVTSSKWKERVESLQELWDNVLSKLKKLKTKQQDYTELLSTLGHIIQKDANVQAVYLAAHSVQQICSKIKPPGFTKHYVSCVFTPLLERTKEKKASVTEVVRRALQEICRHQYPLAPSGHNEDMVEEILQFMKHKTPQIRAECTEFFTFVLKQIGHYEPANVKVLQKYLQDEIGPAVMKIVNDTQPAIRNCGFECFATLIKILGHRELNPFWEKLDNLKRQKIEEHLNNQASETFVRHSRPSSSTNSAAPISAGPTDRNYATVTETSLAASSTIPSKRGPPSPLKKVGKSNSPSVPKSRVLLTSRTLGGAGNAPIAHSPTNAFRQTSTQPTTQTNAQLNRQANAQLDENAQASAELAKLQKDKNEWIRERHELLAEMSKVSSSQTQLINENEELREQLKTLQTEIDERGLQLRSKDLQLGRLQDRIAQLELDLRETNINRRHISSSEASAVSTNLGVRSISSSSFDPTSAKIKHIRTPSESSDDLPRRVDSLQLTSANQPALLGGNTTNLNTTATSSASSDAINEESWKRAAEVTSQLKARIERMRAKTRGIK